METEAKEIAKVKSVSCFSTQPEFRSQCPCVPATHNSCFKRSEGLQKHLHTLENNPWGISEIGQIEKALTAKSDNLSLILMTQTVGESTPTSYPLTYPGIHLCPCVHTHRNIHSKNQQRFLKQCFRDADAGELVECLPTTHQTLCSSPVANNYHPRTLQVETEGS